MTKKGVTTKNSEAPTVSGFFRAHFFKCKLKDDIRTILTSSPNELLYKYLCIIRDGYRAGNFESLFPLLDENIVMHSAWVLAPNEGKDNVVSYYRVKSPALRDNDTPIDFHIVEVVRDCSPRTAPSPRTSLWYPDGKLALYMAQYFPNEVADLILDLALTPEGKIGRIDLCIPGLFSVQTL